MSTRILIDIQPAAPLSEILWCVRNTFEFMEGWKMGYSVASNAALLDHQARFFYFDFTTKRFEWWRKNDTYSDTMDEDEVKISTVEDISQLLEFVHDNSELMRPKKPFFHSDWMTKGLADVALKDVEDSLMATMMNADLMGIIKKHKEDDFLYGKPFPYAIDYPMMMEKKKDYQLSAQFMAEMQELAKTIQVPIVTAKQNSPNKNKNLYVWTNEVHGSFKSATVEHIHPSQINVPALEKKMAEILATKAAVVYDNDDDWSGLGTENGF